MSFVLRVVINGVAIWIATLVLRGCTLLGATTTAEQTGIYLLVGLVFGIVNAVVKPVVHMLQERSVPASRAIAAAWVMSAAFLCPRFTHINCELRSR